MNTIPIVLSFAALVATGLAQTPAAKPTPIQEIAPLVAVEEQEGDLAKAERLYKEAIEGTALSAAAKELATVRLIDLLGKLGKLEERKQWIDKLDGGAPMAFDNATEPSPQERERQQALRAKARELVQKVLEQRGADGNRTGIVNDELRRQVEWLGEAAVPEIGAALAAGKPTFAGMAAGDLSPMDSRTEALRGLAGVLWRMGSPAARAQLEAAYRDGSEAFRVLLATQAVRHAPTLRDLVIQWLNEDPSEAVFWQLARSGLEIGGAHFTTNQGWVEGRNNWEELPPEVFLVAAERRSPALRAKVLRTLPTGGGGVKLVPWSSAAVSRACAMVRELANGTDPEVVRMALVALANPRLQITPEGFDCLVDHLGRIGNDVQLNYSGVPREWQKDGFEHLLAKDVVVRLWPRLVAAARRGLPARSDYWVRQVFNACGPSLDGSMLDDLIALQQLGYYGLLPFLHGRLDPPQALRLVHAFSQMDEVRFEDGAKGLFGNDLPPEALPLLVGKTEMAVRLEKLEWLTTLVARTGNPDAVPWLLAQAERDKGVNLSEHLLQLGRRTQAESVRAAMRKLVEQQQQGHKRSELVLVLLSMHDTATLARIGEDNQYLAVAKHEYAIAKDANPISPLGYVLMDQPDPPHGFTQDELLAFIRSAEVMKTDSRVDGLDPARVPTPLLMVLAETSEIGLGRLVTQGGVVHGESPRGGSSWQEAMARRIASEEDLDGPLHRWLRGVLGTTGPAQKVLDHLVERDLVAIRPQLERMLAGDDEERAMFAFSLLEDLEPRLDFVALTTSTHRSVASIAASRAMNRGALPVAVALRLLPGFPAPEEIADYCGTRLAVEAVPALLQLLQHDSDSVRQAANEALAKIRFVHEQKSYWDRITKGLDASPTSAVEKLLLQAKPGAPAEQRLLAITSLGTLGMPEALPFLIEWTQDADAGIAKAAKDAITQIHLQPRR